MSNANVLLGPVLFGGRKKQPDTDPKVKALVEEWRLARRAGDREGARVLAGKVDKARIQAGKRRS